MAVITDSGIELRTLEQIVTDNTTLWSEKTGDVDVAPSSAAGELIAIKSENDARVDQDIADAFINTTIQASGENLDLVGERKGVYRRSNVPTVANVSITGVDGTIIVQGTEFTCSTNDETFVTQYQVTIAGGVASVTVESENFDQILCPAQTLELTTPITGVTTATNEANGVIGYLEESDTSYRTRIGQVGTNATHIKDGLYFALLSISGVAKARVYDNNTDSVMLGEIPARYFAPVVLGGNETEIAQTVFQFSQNGNPSYGSSSKQVTSERGEIYVPNYSRAVEQIVTITVSYTADSTFDTVNGEGVIIENVVNFMDSLQIGETLFLQKLEAVCFIQGVTSISATIDGATADITPDFDVLLVSNESEVTIV